LHARLLSVVAGSVQDVTGTAGGSSFEVVIREAVAQDIDAWLAFAAGLFSEDAGGRDRYGNVEWPWTHGRASFERNLVDASALMLLAVVDGVPVGALSGRFAEADEWSTVATATLYSLYVLPEHRRNEAGTLLVERFKQWAASKKARRLLVTAYAANDGAARFYRRHGFRELKTTFAIDE
jgi:GNAT superfamily N-acetyltransferase